MARDQARIQIWVVTKNLASHTVFTLEKTITLKEDMDDELLRSMRAGEPMGLTGIQRRPAQENDSIPKVAPKWLKHDRQVSEILNF